jgi:putative restriction endonuclease
MNPRENDEFTEFLRGAVREAERYKYFPNRFKSMLDADGGFEAVKHILASGKPSEGFTRLWELGRLDLTCEAIIVETKWRRYFDEEHIVRAEKLLRASKYQFKPYQTNFATEAGIETAAPSATADVAEKPALETPSSEARTSSGLRINAYFRNVLHAPVANSRWSWGSVDERTRRVFLRLWRMDKQRLDDRDVIGVLGSHRPNRPGWNERARHIDFIKSGYTAYAVICDKDSPESGTILDFDRDNLLRLGHVIEKDGTIYMEIVAAISADSIAAASVPSDAFLTDLYDLDEAELSVTTRSALVAARLGQGRYRRELMRRWNGACAVTGCRVGAVLRASHCKPWRMSNNSERLDSNNGLVLAANLDALFDAGLISFDDVGGMLVAGVLSPVERRALGLPSKLLSAPGTKLRSYLRYHRDHVFLS